MIGKSSSKKLLKRGAFDRKVRQDIHKACGGANGPSQALRLKINGRMVYSFLVSDIRSFVFCGYLFSSAEKSPGLWDIVQDRMVP